MTLRLAVLVLATASFACASVELRLEDGHPARADAPSAPVKPVAAGLLMDAPLPEPEGDGEEAPAHHHHHHAPEGG